MQHLSARDTRNFYRKGFARQLAVSLEADFIYMGFFDCRYTSFVDWWVGHDTSSPREPRPQHILGVLPEIDRAVTTAGHCHLVDHAAGLSQKLPPPPGEAHWILSEDYLVGVGRQVDDLVPVMAVIGGQRRVEEVQTFLQMGMAYVTQELHETMPLGHTQSRNAIETALSMLSIHFAVVDSYGEIDYSTDLSGDWLEENGGFELIARRLSARRQKTQRVFQHALRLATGPARKPSILSLEAQEGRSKIAVIMPVADSSPPRALVTFEQGHDDPILRDHLLRLSGLTNSERRIAHHILDGKSLAETAEMTNLSLATVRSYMKGVFAKTSTHRQSELITHFRNAVPRVKYAPYAQTDLPDNKSAP